MIGKYACIVAKTENPDYASLLTSKGRHTPYTLVRGCEDGVMVITPENYVSGFKELLNKRGIEDTVFYS